MRVNGRPLVAARHAAAPAAAVAGRRPPTARRTTAVRAALDATQAAYGALGLSGVSFVGTFFVAPLFKDSLKEGIDYKHIYEALSRTGVKQVEASEAYAKSSSGDAILLDVRLASKYEASHAAGSLSGPLYLPIQNWDLPAVIRRAGFAFFGIYGTELNTNFAAEVQAKLPQDVEIIVLCETGGSLENKSGTKFGFQSRSLKAVFYLQQAGYKQVAFVTGGLPAWSRKGLPMQEGPEDLSAVPALSRPSRQRQQQQERRSASPLQDLLGGLKLPELSFLPSRR